MSKKCKLCPRKATCSDECYGEFPCEFAAEFEKLARSIAVQQQIIHDLSAENKALQKKAPESRVFGDYVFTPIKNAFNDRTSWWISKRGYTKAFYCFTADDEREVEYQLKNGLDGYIRLFESSVGA